jgi:regulator of nucleoside diphosphate kinase
MKSTNTRTIILSDADHKRLTAIIDSARTGSWEREFYLAALEGELAQARVVPAREVPPDVVTMNSTVRLRDLNSGEAVTYTLVYPASADISENRLSVLAPTGTAIIGYRQGDTIEWSVPAGLKRLRVEEVLYQPERAGAADL